MSHNFLDIKKGKRQFFWRIFALKLLVGVCFSLATFAFISTYSVGMQSLQYISSDGAIAIADEISFLSLPSFDIQEGDAAIEPPPIEPPKLPIQVATTTPPRTLSAAAFLVKDVKTGTVLYAKEEYTPRPLASITKLMSALVLLERDIDWTTSTVVVTDDLIDTHMYAGDTYTLEELWQAALVASSNKAVMTLIDATGWEREAFIARMNERARELGMGASIFVEPTGLDAGNISTASDVVLLLEEALRYEKIHTALLTTEHTIYSKERSKRHHMWNTNWLYLGWIPHTFAEIRGGKTGYIMASEYNFAVEVVDDMGHELFVVILGANMHEARFTEARDIANWVYDVYEWPDEATQKSEI